LYFVVAVGDKFVGDALQLHYFDGLGDKARLVAVGKIAVLGHGGGGKQHYGYGSKAFYLPKLLEGFAPVEHGHIDVQYNKTGGRVEGAQVADIRKQGHPIGESDDFHVILMGLKGIGYQLTVFGVIVGV